MKWTTISLLGKTKNGTTIFPMGNEEFNKILFKKKMDLMQKYKYFEFDLSMINKNT